MERFKVAALAASMIVLACGEPDCPVGTYKIRNVCRKLDAGAEFTSEEAGVGSGDAGNETDQEDAPLDAAGLDLDAEQPAPVEAARPSSDAEPARDDGGLNLEDSGRTCDAGFSLSDADVCADIDESARMLDDCDHDPQACVNTSGGFACACPSGFRGAGKGADGCVDIDECAEGTDSCDSRVTCNNTPGSYSCGSCPAGFSPGDAGACVDLDECTSNNGGCDTSPMATCNNRVGMPNTCTCPSGHAGNGVGPNGCTDPCASNPCGTGFTCTRSAQGTAVCGAACAATGGPGCVPGDKCSTDADCRTGGDSSATCDATDKVCTRICPATTISDQLHLNSARYCREIDGALTLNPNFVSISATDLPYLTRVRGNLLLGVNGVTRSVTFSALVAVDGNLTFANLLQLESVSLPRLATIGNGSAFTMLPLTRSLSMPRLRSVASTFSMVGLPALVQLDLNDLPSAQSLTFFSLCKLPSTQVSRFTMASFTNVGCCTATTTGLGCNGQCTCN